MKKTLFILGFCCAAVLTSHAQRVVVSSDPSAIPDPSAMLEVDGTLGAAAQGGVLVPKMTEVQRDALTAGAAEGLWVYQTDNLAGYYLFDGVEWERIGINTGIAGRVNVNAVTGTQLGISGSGFTSTQMGPGSGVFDINFTSTPFVGIPSVSVTPRSYPATTTGTVPPDYCQPNHLNLCTTPIAADYIDDVEFRSFPAGAYSAANSFNTSNNGCNGNPQNYTNYAPGISGTVVGTNIAGGGSAGSYFDIRMQSGPEWRDNLFGYIDWNQDADFEDPGEAVFEHYFIGAVPFDTQITQTGLTVPGYACNGRTVFRAMTLFVIGIPTPCGTFAWGETQDYEMNVIGGDPACSPADRAAICTVGNVTSSGFRVYCSDLNENRMGTTFNFYATEN